MMEFREIEAARRALLFYEEACRIRVVEKTSGASSSREVAIEAGTADSVVSDKKTT